MNPNRVDLRKENERAHGKYLAPNAIEIWGWGTPAGVVRAQRRAQLLVHHAAIRPSSIVLELGCGTGLFTRYFAATGATIIALDLSPDLLREAAKQSSDRITYQLGDVERLDFPDASFDAVVGSSVLHHVYTQQAIAEAYRVLRSGGRIAFAEPNMLNPQIALQKNIPYLKRQMGDSLDETAFFRWEAVRYLRAAGFQEIFVKPYDFLHPLVPLKLIPFVSRVGKLLEATPIIREISGSLLLAGRKP